MGDTPLYVGIDLGTTNSAAAVFDGEAVSATRIREYLARGEVDRTADLLGRPYDVTGRLDGTAALIRIAPGSRSNPRNRTDRSRGAGAAFILANAAAS